MARSGVAAGQPMTLDEFFALPVAPFRYQLVEGSLVVNEPKLTHQIAVGNVFWVLESWRRAAPDRGHVGMPADFVLDERNIYAPDVWWVAEDRKPQPTDVDPPHLPDLVVEVRNPETWHHDLGAKCRNYAQLGIAELWLVNPRTQIVTVHRRSAPGRDQFDLIDMVSGDCGARLTSPLLPGFSVPVRELFIP